jgi:hypothetical protein
LTIIVPTKTKILAIDCKSSRDDFKQLEFLSITRHHRSKKNEMTISEALQAVNR